MRKSFWVERPKSVNFGSRPALVQMCRLSVVCRFIWWERAASGREKNGSSGMIVEPRGCGAVLSSTLKGSHAIQLLSFSSSRTLKKYVAEFSLPFHGFQEHHVARPEQQSACTTILCRILVDAPILEKLVAVCCTTPRHYKGSVSSRVRRCAWILV